MWAAILSDRLTVIALVSLYLTNKLIVHGPLFAREVSEEVPSIYSSDHAISRDHPVLAAVSRGCPGHKGRLAKYYSPFRRSTRRTSHPEGIEIQAFALDLHA